MIVGKATRQIGRDDIVLATKVHGPMGPGPKRSRELAQMDHRRVREQLEAARCRSHRSVPDPSSRARDRHRRDTRGPHRPGACGKGPLRRELHLPRLPDRRGTVGRRATLRERFVTEQPPYSILARGIEADVLPVCAKYGMGVLVVEPTCRRLAVGKFGKGKDNTSRRAERIPGRYDMALAGNQHKLEIVISLAEVAERGRPFDSSSSPSDSCSPIPEVTSPIIGPRTMEHLDSSSWPPKRDSTPGPSGQDRRTGAARERTSTPADAGWDPPTFDTGGFAQTLTPRSLEALTGQR